MTAPIDLRSLATSAGFRITLDPTADIEPDRSERRWLVRIPCKYGHVAIHSSTELAAYCDASRLITPLLKIPGVRVVQRGDGECRVVFSPDVLERVATLLRASKRPVLSDSERSRRAERMLALRKGHPPAAPCNA